MTRPRDRFAVAAVVGLVTTAAAACGSPGDVGTGTFTVDFPSTAAAIAVTKQTQGVQVFAYQARAFGDASAAVAGACEMLVEQSRTNNVTLVPVAKSEMVSPCDLAAGKGSIAVGFGTYAFLAVAKTHSGEDFLVGCAEQVISSTNTVVSIPMTLASSTVTVPATSCTQLSQACPSGGKC